MHDTTRAFLTELLALFEKYKGPTHWNVELEVEESCGSYGGYSVDGIELTMPIEIEFDGDKYPSYDSVKFYGKSITADDIKEKLEEK